MGIKDFCVYWFRRASDHLKPGQRAGLVGTNSISQNRARSASLEYVVANGGVITDAVSSQKWPGDAKVHVSIVNWVDEPQTAVEGFVIDGVDAEGIGADLRDSSPDAWSPQVLAANKGKCFQGPIPVGAGFIIGADEARRLLALEVRYSGVVRRYLTGEDIANDLSQSPSRWIVDFASRTLEQAAMYPAALDVVRERVKPGRETNKRAARRARWWLFGEKAVGLRLAIASTSRFASGTATGKRLFWTWAPSDVCPSNSTNDVAFDDDFSMAVLQSRAHIAWAWQQSSTLETRLRYTPTSVFETFPWPDRATAEQREHAADVCRRLLARRSALCIEHQVGLTKLYNAIDDGAYADLKALHKELDEAVADCYGWPKSVAQDDKELVRQLNDLNRKIIEGERAYRPFDS